MTLTCPDCLERGGHRPSCPTRRLESGEITPRQAQIERFELRERRGIDTVDVSVAISDPLDEALHAWSKCHSATDEPKILMGQSTALRLHREIISQAPKPVAALYDSAGPFSYRGIEVEISDFIPDGQVVILPRELSIAFNRATEEPPSMDDLNRFTQNTDVAAKAMMRLGLSARNAHAAIKGPLT